MLGDFISKSGDPVSKNCVGRAEPTGAPWQKLVVHYVLQFDRKTEQSPKNMSTEHTVAYKSESPLDQT